MVKYSTTLDSTFAALADPTRRAILTRLATTERTVGELAAPFAMSLPAISKHLRVLERARLITRVKDGRVRRCRLEALPMKAASQWIERHRRFWEQQLDSLEDYLSSTQEEEQAWPSRNRRRNPRSASRARSTSRASGFGAHGRRRRR